MKEIEYNWKSFQLNLIQISTLELENLYFQNNQSSLFGCFTL